MFLKKKGFPEEGELIMCTVSNIHYHSVFVTLDEYEKQGMVHISEISPGRIRNIRDYVKEGKKIVCKVLRIDREKGHIDLSLRRVNESQKREKINEIKQEQLSEKIIEFIAKKRKINPEKMYKQITEKLFDDYDSLYLAFEDVALRGEDLTKYSIDKSIADEITELVKQRIKPPEIVISGDFYMKSYAPEGAEIIKKALKKGESSGEDISIGYKGGGIFKLDIKSDDYKTAEKKLKKVVSSVNNVMEKNDSFAEFVRAEK